MELLKKVLPYLLIVRPKNLLLVGLTQFLIYHYLFEKFGQTVVLSDYLLFLFVLDTTLIAAGGYIINDIVDFRTDTFNKPHKTYIPTSISLGFASIYYYVTLILGLIISMYIAVKTNNIPLVTLYPIASGVLYMYSAKYKNSILLGNIIVSFFVAFVPAIILVAERDILFNDGSSYSQHIVELIVIYAGFSFFVNLIREIIKDVEDVEGDKSIGYITLPIIYGIAIAKRICMVICVFTILFLICWIYLTDINLDFRVRVYLLLLVAAPLAIVIQILTKTTNKRDFSKISTILKWTMLAGLGALIMISNILFQS